ncbi:MAG TPA: alpha/beta hydrolase [Vicinamibacterales bacterium]|nr:alpha/beta hydrolase [Vicinamibacterales bacterium]
MRLTAFRLAALGLLFGSAAYAQDLEGDWQGTLQAGNQPLRLIVTFTPADGGRWTGTMRSIDQGNDWGAGAAITAITREGAQVRFVVDATRGTYEGTLTSDRSSIEGTWTQRQPLRLAFRRATPDTAWKDPAVHTVQFVTVDRNVKLEVLDFGGSGRPLVFLAGLGNTAHVFDRFAPKFTATHHAYAVTRRGFGDSSAPPDGYAADRLGDDVLAVLDALKLARPALAGHSIAGEELSSIASRHPDRVSGLVYLDAGYPYAFYNADRGDVVLDSIDLRRKLDLLVNGPADSRPTIKELMADLPRFERNLEARQKELDGMPPALLAQQGSQPTAPRAIMAGAQKYTNLGPVPILAIYALPHDLGPIAGDDRAAFEVQDLERTGAQAAAFEKGVPSARVVRLPHAHHYVFRSNEADVLREMNAFLSVLQ